MEKEYDVLIVGACTAGLFFAMQMARQGYRTLVIDKDGESALGKRYDIFHLGKATFARFGVEAPRPGDADFVRTFTQVFSRSALDRYPKVANEEIYVLRRHPFMLRLMKWAQELGAEVIPDAPFESLIYDETGKISGAAFTYNGETHRVSARLIADASGAASAVRTTLSDGYGVENFPIGPRDKFYVVLYYATLDDPERDQVNEVTSWPYYKTWKAPQLNPNGTILGVGANLSFEYAEACFKRFSSRVSLPPHQLDYVEQGCTPYRRPPYSFVADGFVALGDAACLTNPRTGEGITAHWLQAQIAAQEAAHAMEAGAYPTKEALWPVNLRYYSAQGAEFAQTLSMLAGAVDCSPEENDYEFEKSIIFTGDSEEENGSLLGKIIKGTLTGRLRQVTLKNLIGAAAAGSRILKHYKAYPKSPDDFAEWTKKADALWRRTRNMADDAEKDRAAIVQRNNEG